MYVNGLSEPELALNLKSKLGESPLVMIGEQHGIVEAGHLN